MRSVVELLYVERVIFKFYDCAFVVVNVAVVRSGEYRDDYGKLLRAVPLVHFVAVELRLVGTEYGQDLVLLQKRVDCFTPERE